MKNELYDELNPPKIQVTILDIFNYFPIKSPYLFMDSIETVNADYIVGTYTFKETEFFYEGHFPGFPVTPGTILQESGAQIGLVAFGMYLLGNQIDMVVDLGEHLTSPEIKKLPGIEVGGYVIHFYLVDSQMRFKKVIQPGEKIIVRSEKVFFKLNKLKCNVTITTDDGSLVAKGVLSGMINLQKSEHGA